LRFYFLAHFAVKKIIFRTAHKRVYQALAQNLVELFGKSLKQKPPPKCGGGSVVGFGKKLKKIL